MKCWAQAGLEVTERTSYAQGHPQKAERDGYSVIRKHGRYMVFPTAVLAELRKKHGPRDAIVEIWNGVPFLTPLWYYGPRVTLLHHIHKDMWDMVLEGNLAKAGKSFETQIAPFVYRRSTLVTLSHSSRDEIQKLFRIKNVLVAPPGIDARFSTSPSQTKSKYPHIVAVGRLMPSKKFDDIIRYAVSLKDKHPQLQVSIVGEGYEHTVLQEQIHAANAETWIHLCGRISDAELVALYQQAWVVASASIAEGWGMTLTEAAACGTPSVATNIVGHKDAVKHKVSGLLANSSEEFCMYLDQLLSDASFRHNLELSAQKFAATFQWETTAYNVFRPLAVQAMRRRSFQPKDI